MVPAAISFIVCIVSFLCASHAARLDHQHHQHPHQHHHQQQHQHRRHQHPQRALEEPESGTVQEETEPSQAPRRHLSGEVEAIKREILEQLGLEAPPTVPALHRGGLLARLQQEEAAWARYREAVSVRGGSRTGDSAEGAGEPGFNPTPFTLTADTGSTVASSSSSAGSVRLLFPLEEVLAACSTHHLRVVSAHLVMTPTLTQTLTPGSTLALMPSAANPESRSASEAGSRPSAVGVRLQRGVRSRDRASVDVSVALSGVIAKRVDDGRSNVANVSDPDSATSVGDLGESGDTLAVTVSLPPSATAAEAWPKPWTEGLSLRVTLGAARSPRRGPPRRGRRDAASEDCADSGQKKCCRSGMRVSFADIGWDDWVKAPAGYAAYVCQGACPHTYKAANRYALLLAKMHRLTGGTVPGPCCVPAAFQPLVLLHYDSDGKMAVSAIEDMIVTRCHCQ